jgi:hypothetical protein
MPDRPTIDVGPIRESFGRVVYTHKTHEKAREIDSAKAVWVKWTNIVLTTLVSGSVISGLVTDTRAVIVIGAILGGLALAFALFQLSFDPAGSAERHRSTAKELWYVREQYIQLISDAKVDPSRAGLAERRDELIEGLKVIYQQAPDTSPRAYKRAQKALKVSEDMTFSDDEIDQFLPSSLHSGQGN